jgi:hypothetical protein
VRLTGKPKAKVEIICPDQAMVNTHSGSFMDRTKLAKKANQVPIFELTDEFTSDKPVDGS